MKNTDRIVHLLRTNPDADITALVNEDASVLTSKVVATTRIPLIRAAVIEFARAVHLSTAQVLRREHVRRTKAELDAAQSRALLSAANRRLSDAARLFGDLENDPEGAQKMAELLKPVIAPQKNDQKR